MTQAAVPDPQEGKQGRHRKGCLCTTHMTKAGIQHVVPQTITQAEVAPMPSYNLKIISALASDPEALKTYMDGINGNAASEESAQPITQAATPPAVTVPLVSRVEIPVAVELPTGKSAKWAKLLDQRQHGPQWSVDTDDIRFANDKIFVSPKRVDLTKRLRIVIENY